MESERDFKEDVFYRSNPYLFTTLHPEPGVGVEPTSHPWIGSNLSLSLSISGRGGDLGVFYAFYR